MKLCGLFGFSFPRSTRLPARKQQQRKHTHKSKPLLAGSVLRVQCTVEACPLLGNFLVLRLKKTGQSKKKTSFVGKWTILTSCQEGQGQEDNVIQDASSNRLGHWKILFENGHKIFVLLCRCCNCGRNRGICYRNPDWSLCCLRRIRWKLTIVRRFRPNHPRC